MFKRDEISLFFLISMYLRLLFGNLFELFWNWVLNIIWMVNMSVNKLKIKVNKLVDKILVSIVLRVVFLINKGV